MLHFNGLRGDATSRSTTDVTVERKLHSSPVIIEPMSD